VSLSNLHPMSIADAAAAAVLYWARDNAITMVAIAGPESSYRNDAPSSTDVWGMPDEQSWWRPYACNRVYSWGLWQIFMPVHRAKLGELTNSSDPCRWSAYLCDPVNNARVAHWVRTEQGFTAWSAYNDRSYLAYMAAAEAAVDEALGPRPPIYVPLPPAVAPPSAAVAPPPTPVAPPPSL